MQIVAQLEHSLSKERERLQAMMAHLHLTKDSAKSASKTPNLINPDRNNQIERSQSEGPPSHSVSPPVSNNENNLRPKSPPLKMRPPPVPPMTGPPPGSLAAGSPGNPDICPFIHGRNSCCTCEWPNRKATYMTENEGHQEIESQSLQD